MRGPPPLVFNYSKEALPGTPGPSAYATAPGQIRGALRGCCSRWRLNFGRSRPAGRSAGEPSFWCWKQGCWEGVRHGRWVRTSWMSCVVRCMDTHWAQGCPWQCRRYRFMSSGSGTWMRRRGTKPLVKRSSL